MRRKVAYSLLLLGFLCAVIAALGVSRPGYMDADYYFAMGRQWANGMGELQPFIWNYLEDPHDIPTISHTYWSPLTSMLSAVGLWLLGGSFRAAQMPFIVATALLPYLTWRLALALNLEERHALLGGLLALAPGFFLPFFVTTDGFSLYALLGVSLMLTLQHDDPSIGSRRWLLSGVICGMAHLSRADGFLMLLFPITFLFRSRRFNIKNISLVLAGYSIIMAPWLYRNQVLLHTFLPSGSSRALWLLNYDETFLYPADTLTYSRWTDAGLVQLLLHRWLALKTVVQRIIAENGLVFLLPLMGVGFVKHRGKILVQAAGLYLAALLILMVVIFPFAGARGGWFHSSVALMPLLWALAPVGLSRSVAWLGKRRNWQESDAQRVFSVATVTLTVIVTVGLYAIRVLGFGSQQNAWSTPSFRYAAVKQTLLRLDPSPGVVAINNPPGFYNVSGIKSTVIPAGDSGMLKQVIDDFDVSWLILDQNHPPQLERLFRRMEVPDWLMFETSVESLGETFILYRVVGD